MRKLPFFTVITVILLLVVFMFTPRGRWVFVSIIGTNSTYIVVMVVAVLAIALAVTFPYKKSIKVVRICLCIAVVVVSAFYLARTQDFGGNFYGEWVLMQDARVRGFNIASSPNFTMYFFEDRTLLKTYLDSDTSYELEWHIFRGFRDILIISGTPYEYRFSHFGNRLILELGGAERPRIPFMTQPRDLEITFRR